MCSKQDCFHLNFKAVIQSENIQNNSESKKKIFRETGYRPSRYGFKFSHKFQISDLMMKKKICTKKKIKLLEKGRSVISLKEIT